MTASSDVALDVGSYTRTAHAAWSSFVRSRLDPQNAAGSLGSIPLRTQVVDIELEMLQHYTAIARQRKNALSAVGRLPEELLAMIFMHAQSPSGRYLDGWLPRRYIEEVEVSEKKSDTREKKAPTKVVRYDLGWIHATHVCSTWRMAALHAHNLWQSLNCFALPVRSVPTIVARAGTLPLRIKAHERITEDIKTAELSTWLSSPLLRRAKVLDLSTYSGKRLDEWAAYLIHPLRDLQELSISTLHDDTLASIPESIFASQCPPALRSLSLCDCSPDWESPLFSANLTILTLKASYITFESDFEVFFPTALDFRNMLSVMSALESLTLDEFLPVKDPGNAPPQEPYHFPPNFRNLRVRCESLLLFTEGHYAHFFACCDLPSTVVLIVDASIPDDTMEEDEDQVSLGHYLAPVTHTYTSETQSSIELMLSYETVALRFDAVDESSPWTLCGLLSQRPSKASWNRGSESYPADVLDEYWDFNPDQWASGCAHGGRLWRCNWVDISKYVNLLPLPSIDTLTLVPNAMSRFATAETWLKSFDTARLVERISASYLRCVHLFSALSRLRDDTGEPFLFPRLSTIVFMAEEHPLKEHQALRTALDIYLKDVLVIRKEAGTPIRHIYVDKSLVSWCVWAEVDDGTVVSFFDSEQSNPSRASLGSLVY